MKTIIEQLPDRGDFLGGKQSVEIGYPWLTYGAIMAIEEELKPWHTVLELGSGGSTLFFSKRCKNVKSYETNSEWKERVEKCLPNPSNVELVCGGPPMLLRLLHEEPDNHYDWLLVDTEDFGDDYFYRAEMMKAAIPKLKVGGFMVIDNYAMGHLGVFDLTGWDVYTFDDLYWFGRGTKICAKVRLIRSIFPLEGGDGG